MTSVDVKMEDVIRELTRRRGNIKGRLTSFKKYIMSVSSHGQDNISSKVHAELKLRIVGIENLFKEFCDVQNKIEKFSSESDIDSQLKGREEFENEYYSTLAEAQCIAGSQDCEFTDGMNTSRNTGTLRSIKLPTIALPSFNGSCENWLEYRDTFLSLIHNSNEISSIQKFHYLKSSLSGNALLVIDSLEFSANNYPVAWELLLNRYNNHKLLIHNHVKALFSLQALTTESPSSLRKLIDSVLKNIRALKSLGEPVDYWHTLLIYMTVTKLDSVTEREWEQYKITIPTEKCDADDRSESKSSLTIDILLDFLRHRAEMLDTITLTHKNITSTHKRQDSSQKVHKTHCHIATQSNKNEKAAKSTFHKRLCPMCNNKHPLYSCQSFLDSNVENRLKLVNDKGLCVNCLNSGHTSHDCRYGPCRKCEKKHNSLLHSDGDVTSENQTNNHAIALLSINTCNKTGLLAGSVVRQCDTNTHTQVHTVLSVNRSHTDDSSDQLLSSTNVLLATACVEVRDCSGKYIKARAILDSGSERCFITKSLCKKLNTQVIQSTMLISGVGNAVTKITQICDIEVHSLHSQYTKRIQCLVLPHITSTLPHILFKYNSFQVPDHIQLADPVYNDGRPIDILIGADIFWDLIEDGRLRLSNGPYLQNTKFGWILSGPIYSTHLAQQVRCNFTQSLDNIMRSFWELEEKPISSLSESLSSEERMCEDHFVRTAKRLEDGRFCVKIPFKQSPELLGKTFQQAEKRFIALENRLQRNENYKKLYCEFINEYIKLGHMTRITEYNSPHYFMPHHGVFREHSTTTKLRVVFDASAQSSNGNSLNNLQMVGPPIQGDLISILLRFREHRYVACADIEKMYRQVLVDKEQRHLQLILWRENPSDPLDIYQLNTVTYGTASAPFLSCRCLKQLAQECNDAEVARVINEDFYVDDLICGASEISSLTHICDEVTEVLKLGCFQLRKWIFNFNFQSTENIPKELSLGEYTHSKTLGIGWFNYNDEFYFHTQVGNQSEIITKRVIFSRIAQIFDPLGLLSPIITTAKILIQRLWLLKVDWDEPAPNDVTKAWLRFVDDLSTLNNIRIPRYVMSNNHTHIQLHIFTDASQVAYGACAYVRTVSSDSSVCVRLLCAKGKVAPVASPITIPRLELCGALIGARLYDKIIKSLRCQFDEVIFWTDSTIVLGWLRMPPACLKTYVQNRITQIHNITKQHSWNHVSGKDNPADLVSRGLGLHALQSSNLWWEGPQFLHNNNLDCTLKNTDNISSELLPEIKSTVIVNTLLSSDVTESYFPFERFSQFNRLQRTGAYVLRFIYNARNSYNKRTGVLSVDELNESVLMLAKMSQLESFRNEYDLLSKNNSYAKLKHTLGKLNLFIDKNKLIRVGGRIENSSQFSFDKKHPILLSSKHVFTHLLFRYEHKQLLHAPPQLLLYTIRNTWWPVGGRNLAKRIVHNCVTCVRMRGKTLSPIMGNLPEARLEPGFPFLRCGVDYAGPVYVLNRRGRGAKTFKAYICLFICFVTRAVHLELVSDLTSDAYLLALKRFISRRGKPIEIFSDNGKNFVGLKNEFSKFLSSCSGNIREYAISQNIKFSMIPPYASHFGGLWEAGVKSCKHHLIRVVGNAHLTFEEFSTVLSQVESILNSRPLNPMSTESTDFLPLTPAHFLVGRPLTSPASEDLTNIPAHRIGRYQRVEQLRQHFWARWSKEYISELQTRCKWTENKDSLITGTMVLIKDDNLPPLKWSIGRIINTYPGKDGISRVADIRTASGIVRRSFAKLCPLLNDEE